MYDVHMPRKGSQIVVASYFSRHQVNIKYGKRCHSKIHTVLTVTVTLVATRCSTRIATEAITAAASPTSVTVSIIELVIPTIPKLTVDNIENKMLHSHSPKSKGKPNHTSMSILHNELIHDTITVISPFGEGGGARSRWLNH